MHMQKLARDEKLTCQYPHPISGTAQPKSWVSEDTLLTRHFRQPTISLDCDLEVNPEVVTNSERRLDLVDPLLLRSASNEDTVRVIAGERPVAAVGLGMYGWQRSVLKFKVATKGIGASRVLCSTHSIQTS